MIGAIAFWDHAEWVNQNPYAQKKIFNFWNFTARSFGGPNLILIDINNNDPTFNDEQVTLEVHKTLTEAITAHPNANYVFLEVKNKIPLEFKPKNLKDFIHPSEDVYYVVASDFGTIPFHDLNPNNNNFHTVYIDTINNCPLWSHTALAIALYDRSIKL